MRRIAWRIQADAGGGISERANRRAGVLARDAELGLTAPKDRPAVPPMPARGGTRTGTLPQGQLDDRRPPGSALARKYKGGVVQVKVLSSGFEPGGEVHRSLSAAAKTLASSHCNGSLLFGLTGDK